MDEADKNAFLGQLLVERAITEKINQYTLAWDRADLASYLDVFTEDAVYEVASDGTGPAARRVEGKAALRAYMEARPPRAPETVIRHMNINIRIDVSASSARAMTDYLALKTDQELGPNIQSYGWYEDEFVKVDGDVWKMQHRVVHGEAAVAGLR